MAPLGRGHALHAGRLGQVGTGMRGEDNHIAAALAQLDMLPFQDLVAEKQLTLHIGSIMKDTSETQVCNLYSNSKLILCI